MKSSQSSGSSSRDAKRRLRLLCTDFDGTLYLEHENPSIPAGLQEQLRGLQRGGVLWIINTGRDLSSIMEELGRCDIGFWPDYLVVVEREIYRRYQGKYEAHAAWNDRCTRTHGRLFDRVRADLPALLEWIRRQTHATVYEDFYSPLCYIATNNQESDAIQRYLEDYARGIPELTVMRNDVYARLSHRDFNKGSALEEISRIHEIIPEEIAVAGDHFNDLPMLDRRYARWLMAPANAMPEVARVVGDQGGHLGDRPAGHGVLQGLEWLRRQLRSR